MIHREEVILQSITTSLIQEEAAHRAGVSFKLQDHSDLLHSYRDNEIQLL